MLKIAIIREGKIPPDSRVVLSPKQCSSLKDKGWDLTVQSSTGRCYTNDEYKEQHIRIVNDLSDREVLIGVKEVPVQDLIENKIYFFFSHTIKKQSYNRAMLRKIIEKKIHLIDYEVLTDDNGIRLIAFGYFAGMVGAHNAMFAYGERSGKFHLKRMKDFFDYKTVRTYYQDLEIPSVRIVLTGTGRVASGAVQVLQDMGVKKVPNRDYLDLDFNEPVFTQVGPEEYAKRTESSQFDLQHFFRNPSKYESNFLRYTQRSDIMINGIYYDPAAPPFFTLEQMQEPAFRIRVFADVTCDIAPHSSIPCTIRPSTIQDPVYGFDFYKNCETAPYLSNAVDVMAIDNLPNELPRDASHAFGEMFIELVLPELKRINESKIIERATIARDGKLGLHFQYLQDFLKGEG